MSTAILVMFVIVFIPNKIFAQHVVKTADELIALLSEEKNMGTILLDGEIFSLAGVEAKAGGVVKPYPGRKPVIMGFRQTVKCGNRKIDENGYWTAPIKGYGSTKIVFLDENLEAIPYACHINGKDGFNIKESDIKMVDEKNRIVGIPIQKGFEYLANNDKTFFKNFSIKLSYWFVGMELWDIYSDEYYIYGTVDNKYNFNLLKIRPYANVHIEFFNLPMAGDGIYLDGNDVLHVPAKYNMVSVCTTPPIFRLTGDNDLMFIGITFTGANNHVIDIEGSNKHFENCIIRNCGKGLVAKGKLHNCSVKNCLIENLYDNSAIAFSEIDGAVVEGNTIRHTGMLMKGGSVVSVGGLNFKVHNNNISDYSYNAISAGLTREYRLGTVSGVIRGNVIDNAANYGDPDSQLDDGGAIYLLAHTDGVEVSDNIIRNIGYEKAWVHGIYLDDGAYNVTVRNNLVYNINSSSKAIYARYVKETEHSCMNNVFEGNICVGKCFFAGNQTGLGKKTLVKNNFTSEDFENTADTYVYYEGNKKIDACIHNGNTVRIDKKCGLKKRKYSRDIRKIIMLK